MHELPELVSLRKLKKLRINNCLSLSRLVGLGSEVCMLTNIMLYIAATRQSIKIRVVYITTEDKGYVQSSDTKSVCLLL